MDATPYYHCVSRCVRQSYLCGHNHETHVSYDHRKQWVEDKMKSLTATYCLSICAYAIMSNHYHVVVYINKNKALNLSPLEVVERWAINHKLPLLIKRWLKNELTNQLEENKCHEIIQIWRKRLWNLSWFMKELNFDIAYRANLEDKCKGHFWESRFKSQALLDDKALLAAMAYVDLNPIRAGVAKTPETSDFTSFKTRLDTLQNNRYAPKSLLPFEDDLNEHSNSKIPFKFADYIELIDWTAREFRQGKVSLSNDVPPILNRLTLKQNRWLKACNELENSRFTAIGNLRQANHAKKLLGKSKISVYQIE
ncbi:transposase [Vibrio sp. UCD-FRSSP16_10]|nr:transposase [Vibrio sp. UCD-FRSSP16_30]OBT17193.1 transposase [Vibrio sp. UCD-FRSSP16_10]